MTLGHFREFVRKKGDIVERLDERSEVGGRNSFVDRGWFHGENE